MEAVLAVIIVALGVASMTVSTVAIIQILSNDFKESKFQWILISMIGFVGPILWLASGRKHLIKRTPNEQREIDARFNFKQHYKTLIFESNVLLRVSAAVGVFLILFGYSVRLFDIPFFWESKPLGLVIIQACVILLLWKDITIRKDKNVKRLWSNIVFGVFCLILFVKGLLLAILPFTDAFDVAKRELAVNEEILMQVGTVSGFSILPDGGIQTTTDSDGTYGSANLSLIIKGELGYTERTVYLETTPTEEWNLVGME